MVIYSRPPLLKVQVFRNVLSETHLYQSKYSFLPNIFDTPLNHELPVLNYW